MPRRESGLRPIGDSVKKIIERIRKEREERRRKNKPIRTQPKLPGMKKGGMKDPSKAIRSVKPTLGRKKTEEFLRKLKDKKKKMGGGMLRYNKGGGADSGTKGETRSKVYSYARKMKDKDRLTQRDIEKAEKMLRKKKLMKGFKKGGFPDLSGDGKTTMKDVLIGRGVIKKKSGGHFDKKNVDEHVRVIDLQKQGKTSKKGIRVKGKGKSFMDVYKKTVYNRADGGMVPFGGEKRVPGSGAATRGTGFKGIF